MRLSSRARRSVACVLTLALVALVAPAFPAAAAPVPGSFAGLTFNGTNQGVGFGDAPAVGLSSFTIEAWFMRTGTGTVTTTGTGGIQDDAIPIVSKGRGEAEGSTSDMNWFLGIDDSADVIAADFEDRNGGANHPVFGVTPLQNNTWYHAAAAYNSSSGVWNLYLNGQLEATLTVPASPANGRLPRNDSIQDAGIGTAYNSTGTAAGSFAGVIDEVRVWNGARTQAQIRDTSHREIVGSTSGLAAMWRLNEGTGTSVGDSVGTTNSTSFANNPTWSDGVPLAPTPVPGDHALNLGGNNAYADLGDPNALDLTTFTIEAWVKKAAGGSTVNTGSGGVDAYPIITKGRAEGETAAADLNYFLGIDAAGKLVADFEEAATGATPGLNHPVTGATTIANGAWHHVAATYNGSTLALYVDGQPDGSVVANQPANAANTAPVGVGTAMNSLGRRGAASGSFVGGYFSGAIDEVRIWNQARSSADVLDAYDAALTSGTGLVTRLGFDEGAGVVAADSVGGDQNALIFTPGWVTGFSSALPAACTPDCALDFSSGSQQHVAFGDPNSLDLSRFTIETWFRRDGNGVAGTTGTGGITNAIPLMAHGSQQSEDSGLNMNWFLGIDDATDRLVADFEEAAAGDNATGLNHPISGTTQIQPGVWYHAAATYDYDAGTDTGTWKLYLNGNPEPLSGDATPNQPPESATTQPAALATTVQTNGTTFTGFFDGALDEPRVWNRALSASEIAQQMDDRLTSGTGLVARWGLDDGTGTTVDDAVGSANGTVANGPAWIGGAPFTPANFAPSAPTIEAPDDGAVDVALSPTLEVGVSDPEGDAMDVEFWGRPIDGGPPAEDFTLVALPDTQFYVESPALEWQFRAQTQWIVDNADDLNIKFVSQLGDITDNGDSAPQEWTYADAAMDILDNNGIPNNLAPGNHDLASNGVATRYDATFPPSRYSANDWYGGYLGDPTDGIDDDGRNRGNKDNYQTFSVGGLNFLIIHLEADIPDYAIEWADRVLDAYPNHRAIISTHIYVNEFGQRPTSPYYRSDGNSAAAVWNELISPNCNIFLTINGHYHGEANRTDPNSCGEPVQQLVMDYQEDANGGDGWLRYLTFEPAQNEIEAFTYSPTRNGGAGDFESDANSRFTLPYAMSAGDFQLIGTDSDVASGTNASIEWADLEQDTTYEWYAVADDGPHSTTGPTASFSTVVLNHRPTLNAIGDQAVTEMTQLAFTATASDVDLPPQALTYTLEPGTGGAVPAGASIGSGSGAFSWTPAESQNGVHTFDVCVSDGTLSDCETIDVTVSEANLPPVLGAVGNRVVDELSPLQFTATATDPDLPANTLAYTLRSGTSGSVPAGATIGSASGAFSWTPSEAQDGTHTFDVCVSDGVISDCETIIVTVNEIGQPLLFSDNFESGTLSNWVVEGLTVQQNQVAGGAWAARATTTGARASAYRNLGVNEDEIYYRARFKVVSNTSAMNVMRIYSGSSTPIASLVVTAAGKLNLTNHGPGPNLAGPTGLKDGNWHEVQIRLLMNGANGESEVWLDGARVGALSATGNFGTALINRVHLGETATGRTSDVAYDDVAVDTAFIPTLPPIVPPGALPFNDGFESGTLSNWVADGLTVQQGEVAAGSWAARSTTTGAKGSAYRNLGVNEDEIYYRARFKVVSGPSAVNLMRIYSGPSTPLASLVLNAAGKLNLTNHGPGPNLLGPTGLKDGDWHELQIRLRINGANGQSEVWLDGVRIGSLSVTDNFGTGLISRIHLGETATGRTSDVAYDDVTVSTSQIPTLP